MGYFTRDFGYNFSSNSELKELKAELTEYNPHSAIRGCANLLPFKSVLRYFPKQRL